jgi:small-conductance mechanosensitive channel
LREVLNALINTAAQQGAVTRATRTLIMTRLAQLANNREADPQARAEAFDGLRRLTSALSAVTDVAENAHRRATRDEIERFLARPEAWQPPVIPAIPPGPPI